MLLSVLYYCKLVIFEFYTVKGKHLQMSIWGPEDCDEHFSPFYAILSNKKITQYISKSAAVDGTSSSALFGQLFVSTVT